jgi:hypothetical protein
MKSGGVKDKLKPIYNELEIQMGWKHTFTFDTFNKIMTDLENSSEGLNKIAKRYGISQSTIRDVIMNDVYAKDRYNYSKQIQLQNIADEMIDISDNDDNNANQIKRDQLRIDTRKWILSRLNPNVYGDKLQTENRTTIIEQKLFNLDDDILDATFEDM